MQKATERIVDGTRCKAYVLAAVGRSRTITSLVVGVAIVRKQSSDLVDSGVVIHSLIHSFLRNNLHEDEVARSQLWLFVRPRMRNERSWERDYVFAA
jgi:hypothetical protein